MLEILAMADFCQLCDNFCDGDEQVCDRCFERSFRHALEEQVLCVRIATEQLLSSPDLAPHDRELAESILKVAQPIRPGGS